VVLICIPDAGTELDSCSQLELGLAKYLLDIVGVQFYTAKTLIDELREDGEVELWAINPQYCLSVNYKMKYNKKDEGSGYHIRTRVDDRKGLGGTVGFIYEAEKPKKRPGTLYYILREEKGRIESIRIISPWDIRKTMEAFQQDEIKDIIGFKGMIVVNLGEIKTEIDSRIEKRE